MLKRIYRKIKYLRKKNRISSYLNRTKRMPLQYLGTKYGGFNVVPTILRDKNDAIVYSFGIGEDISFSEDMLNCFNCSIYAYDPTPKSISYVRKHSISSTFHKFKMF